jgi:hypothetical protein
MVYARSVDPFFQETEMYASTGQSQHGWLRTHWKTVACIVLGVILFDFAAGLLFDNSGATKLAVMKAESSPMLAELLGTPLRIGWNASGHIATSPSVGHADMKIPISGPKGKGILYVVAYKQAGIWHLEMLQFESKGSNQTLDLLQANVAPSH